MELRRIFCISLIAGILAGAITIVVFISQDNNDNSTSNDASAVANNSVNATGGATPTTASPAASATPSTTPQLPIPIPTGTQCTYVPPTPAPSVIPPVYPVIDGHETLYNARTINTCGSGKKFAVTLDDGPQSTFTQHVLDEFAAEGIAVTFFVSPNGAGRGADLGADCDALRRARAQGHQIEGHTFDHFDLRTLAKDEIREQMELAQRYVSECTGRDDEVPVSMTQMRPPFGSLDRQRRLFIEEELGLDVVVWNVDSNDWRRGCNRDGYMYGDLEGNKRNIYDAAKQFVDNDEPIVLLMHDHHYRSGTAKWIKDYYGTQLGYEFVTMNECCTALSDCITPQGYNVWA